MLLLYSSLAIGVGKFVMITAGGNVNAHEQKLSEFLVGLGFEVEIHSDAEQYPC